MASELDHSCLLQSADEQPNPTSAETKGNIPWWLTGTFFRNGPGRFECGNTSFNHWFDGKGLLHRFHIQDGQVTYNNRFVRSKSFSDSVERGKSPHLEFGTFILPDPCQNIFDRFFSRFWGKEVPFDNAMDTVFTMKDKMYAAADTNYIFEIDPETLETLRTVDFTKEFPGDVKISSPTAHPHQTPDGSVINISIKHGRNSTYRIIQIPPSSGKEGEASLEGGKVLCCIPPTSGVGYIHSFSLTDNYIVLTEVPLVLDIWRVIGHRLRASSFEEWLNWDANQFTRFHVVDRKDGNRVGVFTAEPFFVFHHINAFEKDGKIYIDACCYPDNSIIKQLYLYNLRSPSRPGEKKFDVPDVRRYELPLGELGDADVEKPLHKGGDGLDYSSLYPEMEMPKINYEEYNGKPYRFVYGVAAPGHTNFVNQKVIKLNVETREFVTWEESGGFASEPVFVKAPDGKDEDDGVVLTCVINVSNQTTSLLVLDAKDLKELGRGVVQGITPATYHSYFTSKQKLRTSTI